MGWLWSQELGLYLGIFQGQLRYFEQEGTLVPTPQEAALAEMEQVKAERQRAESERQKAESERQRADEAETKAALLAQRLRELGIEPDSL